MVREHPNARIAMRMWQAAADGDGPELRKIFSDAIVWRSPGRNPLSGEFHGPDAVLDYLARVGEDATELKLTLDEVFPNDSGAVLTYHVSARRGAQALEMDGLLRLAIRNGQVISAISVPVDQLTNDEFWM